MTDEALPGRAAGAPVAHPLLVVVVLGFSSLCAALMQSLVIPIQAELPTLLHTSASNASWAVTATLLGGSVAMPVAGRLADIYGKKPVMVVAGVALLAGSVLCAISGHFLLVVAGRVLQGMAMGYIPVAIGLTIGLVGVLAGVTKGNDWGWNSPGTLSMIIGGMLVLLIWGVYEIRHRDPLADLTTTARVPVLFTNLAALAMGFGMKAQSIVVPQLLQMPEQTGFGLGNRPCRPACGWLRQAS